VPEYLAPGVYVEETSFRAKSIEGVGTSTTGFVGLALKGPVGVIDGASFITSFGDFERIYGGFQGLSLTGLDTSELSAAKSVNYLAHSVQAFFNNGGSRLYVSRVYPGAAAGTTPGGMAISDELASSPANDDAKIHFMARFPGAAGNGTITVTLNSAVTSKQVAGNLPAGSFVRMHNAAPSDAGDTPTYFVKGTDGAFHGSSGDFKPDSAALLEVLTFTVSAQDSFGDQPMVYNNLGFSPNHPRWAGAVLNPKPKRLADARENLFALYVGKSVTEEQLFNALFPKSKAPADELKQPPPPPFAKFPFPAPNRSFTFGLTKGSDGAEPTPADFDNALTALDAIEEVAIEAAPGSSVFDQSDAIIQDVLIHVQKPRAYRIAVLEAPPAVTGKDVQVTRSKIDSTYAAFYYPWIWVSNPLARPEVPNIPAEILVPPAGFIAGIYARTDELYGVFKAPANEVVLGALRFETDINFATQGILNPLGINCLRFFAGRGYRVWGARTASSDPEWKYVNVRRYFLYLEHSIDNSTQWAVFENNGPALWNNIRETVESFLYTEWKNGALLGSKPEEAYFVRCDRTTMTQNDLDNGRMICLIGVAVLKPAEFVIFRIGQKTADAKS
jgi:uncharacterized protein